MWRRHLDERVRLLVEDASLALGAEAVPPEQGGELRRGHEAHLLRFMEAGLARRRQRPCGTGTCQYCGRWCRTGWAIRRKVTRVLINLTHANWVSDFRLAAT